LCASAAAQQTKPALPSITSAVVPLYPSIARAANVEGAVHVRVTTDGHRVAEAHVEDGQKILANAAEANALTWQFASHEPTTFTVTYRYKLGTDLDAHENNPRVLLQLPSEIEIDASRRPPIFDSPAELGYFSPSVCELVADAEKHAGKPVAVRAVLASGSECAIVRDDTCQPAPGSGKLVLATLAKSTTPNLRLPKDSQSCSRRGSRRKSQ